MCGIVVSLPTYDGVDRLLPLDARALAALLPDVPATDPLDGGIPHADLLGVWEKELSYAADSFRGPGAIRLVGDPTADRTPLRLKLDRLDEWAVRLDRALDAQPHGLDAGAVEELQAALRRVRDQLWAIEHDGIGLAEAAWALTPGRWTARSVVSYTAVATALDVLDRLEVRGRDSAGVSIWVALDEADRAALRDLGRADPLLRNGAVLPTADGLALVYKRAAIVGSLGDNTAALRAAIRTDDLLHAALALPSARVTVLGHTRWASVGRTSESNAHPVDNTRPDGSGRNGPVSLAVLNGDVDNYLALHERMGNVLDPAGVTTDAKLIPLLVSEGLAQGHAEQRAVTDMLRACSGSMAIAVQSELSEGDVHLAVKGSGQSLFVGFTPSGYLVASEIYGLVGQTQQFVRVDGTAPGGTVLRLRRDGGGRPEGIERWDATGTALPPIGDPQVSDVTSRDLARGSFEHYLDKELHDAPESFRRTLRGRIDVRGPRVRLPESSLPEAIRRRITDGGIRTVVVVGQGTAAVAAQGVAHVLGTTTGGRLAVTAMPATEFSAWRLRPDMADTLVVAISQSGSTTDTNRAVDLARERGCGVLAVVNRRDSDLAHKSNGVLYTSDGRDVELSVASTKAFYAQVAAGALLAVELGRLVGALTPGEEQSLLDALLALPGQLRTLLAATDSIRPIAEAVAARYPNWSVVGSGPNRVAANEIRIKLSELCYRAVAVDAVEDKKHIDLSAESLVLVCAAGAPPDQVSDLVKEVEILQAHNNRPVVVCDADTVGLWPTDLVIPIPPAAPVFDWLLGTAAGHLLSYHLARAIDATGAPLREALEELELLVDAGADLGASLPPPVVEPVAGLLGRAADGDLRGVLSSSSALALSGLLFPRSLRAGALLDRAAEARQALDTAIEELTRSIDTIKHQAKTVTVGTTRGDADLLDNVLVQALRDAGVDVRGLGFAALDVVRAFAGVVAAGTGITRYAVDRTAPEDRQLRVLLKTGSAADLPSRADAGGPLTGQKRLAVDRQLPLLVRGQRDGRTVVVVPEFVAGLPRAISLVHVELLDVAPAEGARRAAEATGHRAAEVVAAVTEVGLPLDAVWELPPSVLLLDPLEQMLQALTAHC
jgi:glucosamine--fructose-6-phosphate aminotransferase (isomerizing)